MINCICKFLLNLGYIILTGLPYYLFFIFMYFLLKKLSPDGNLSKRFYNPINSERENKFLSSAEFITNYIYKNAMVFSIILIFAIVILIIIYRLHYEFIIEYIVSAAALRLQKYIIENLLTIILAVIGSVAIFSSLNKKYYLFFSSKDIVRSLKVKEDVISIITFYLICITSTFVYYIEYYIGDDTKDISEVLKDISFCVSIISSVIVLIWLLKLFYSIIIFLFSDKTENQLLDSLYYYIHDRNDKKIYISNEIEIQENIKYLLLNLKGQLKICNEKISFISYLEEYDEFAQKTKVKNLAKTIFYAIIVHLIFAFYIFGRIESIYFSLFSFVSIIILNICVCYILYKTQLRSVFIHTQMWSWGFLIEKGDKKYYCSTVKSNITNKKYNNYFKCLYSIVCLYKIVLSSDEKYAEYFLSEIIKYANNNDCDYILYSLCLYLYCSKYENKKAKLLEFKKFIKNNNIDWDVLQTNIVAIINEIYRYDSSNDVKRFISSIKESNNTVKIQIVKKQL